MAVRGEGDAADRRAPRTGAAGSACAEWTAGAADARPRELLVAHLSRCQEGAARPVSEARLAREPTRRAPATLDLSLGRFDGGRGSLQLADPIANRTREPERLLVRGAAGSERRHQLLVGDSSQVSAEPAHVVDTDAGGDVCRPLSDVPEPDHAFANAGDELRVLCLEAVRVPPSARDDIAAPAAHRPAPVGDEIAGFTPPPSDAVLEDRGVRAARDVAPILRVPVREQHDEHLEAVQLRRAQKGVVVPGPA